MAVTSLNILIAAVVALWQYFLSNLFSNGYRSTEWSCDEPHADPLDVEECANDYYAKHYRTLTGKCNNLDYPLEGISGTHFNRLGRGLESNIPQPDEIDIYNPNPYDIAKQLLHAKPNKEPNIASKFNALMLAWLQFIVHDMVGHEQYDITDNPHEIISETETMYIPRQKQSDTPTAFCPYKQFKNRKTAYFDASQLYGINEEIHNQLMDDNDARKFKLEYISEYDEYQLPFNATTGQYLVGERGNFWTGLNIYHLLFAQEHNHIIDELDKLYPDMDSTSIYHTARLIISAFIAKTHVLEFFTLFNMDEWSTKYGLGSTYLSDILDVSSDEMNKFPYLFDTWIKIANMLGQKEVKHHPYQRSELWDALYTMHNIFQEDVYLNHYDANIENIEKLKLSDLLLMNNTRNINNKYSMKDIIYSFGTLNHPRRYELNSYPTSFTHFTTDDGLITDLSVVDLIRFRERGLPKYTATRRLLSLEEITSYEQLTNDEDLIDTLEQFYDNIDDMDLLIGMMLENTGGLITSTNKDYISQTQLHALFQSALFKLNDDRFFNKDLTVDTYTEYGLQYLATTYLRDVIIRHYPVLEDKIHPKYTFAPWGVNKYNIDDALDSFNDKLSDLVNKYNIHIMEYIKHNLRIKYWIYEIFDINIEVDPVSDLSELSSLILSKLKSKYPSNEYYPKMYELLVGGQLMKMLTDKLDNNDFVDALESLYDKYKDLTYSEILDEYNNYIKGDLFQDNFVIPEKWGDAPLMNNVFAGTFELKYNAYPMNEDEAIETKWILFHDGCEINDNSNLPGKIYYINDDLSHLLIYNSNGLFSGLIHAFYSDVLNDHFINNKYRNPFNKYIIKEEIIYGIEILTRDPHSMCDSSSSHNKKK
eukprot:470699_1